MVKTRTRRRNTNGQPYKGGRKRILKKTVISLEQYVPDEIRHSVYIDQQTGQYVIPVNAKMKNMLTKRQLEHHFR